MSLHVSSDKTGEYALIRDTNMEGLLILTMFIEVKRT